MVQIEFMSDLCHREWFLDEILRYLIIDRILARARELIHEALKYLGLEILPDALNSSQMRYYYQKHRLSLHRSIDVMLFDMLDELGLTSDNQSDDGHYNQRNETIPAKETRK